MIEILEFIFSGFWIWLGTFILVSLLFITLFKFYNRYLRHRNILKHGYPPPHCDADGDFPEEKDNEEKR